MSFHSHSICFLPPPGKDGVKRPSESNYENHVRGPISIEKFSYGRRVSHGSGSTQSGLWKFSSASTLLTWKYWLRQFILDESGFSASLEKEPPNLLDIKLSRPSRVAARGSPYKSLFKEPLARPIL